MPRPPPLGSARPGPERFGTWFGTAEAGMGWVGSDPSGLGLVRSILDCLNSVQPCSALVRPSSDDFDCVQMVSCLVQPHSAQLSPVHPGSAQFSLNQPSSAQFSPVQPHSAGFIPAHPIPLNFSPGPVGSCGLCMTQFNPTVLPGPHGASPFSPCAHHHLHNPPCPSPGPPELGDFNGAVVG